jgi:hypothetical protein
VRRNPMTDAWAERGNATAGRAGAIQNHRFLAGFSVIFPSETAPPWGGRRAFDHHRERTTTMASTTVYPTTIFPTIGRRNAVLMFLMGLGLILAIGWFINGISIEPTNAIDQQVRYLSYVISAAGWIIFTLSLFLGITISQLDVIAEELRKLSAVSAEPAPSQPVQSP